MTAFETYSGIISMFLDKAKTSNELKAIMTKLRGELKRLQDEKMKGLVWNPEMFDIEDFDYEETKRYVQQYAERRKENE
jgi:hypothetical protein